MRFISYAVHWYPCRVVPIQSITNLTYCYTENSSRTTPLRQWPFDKPPNSFLNLTPFTWINCLEGDCPWWNSQGLLGEIRWREDVQGGKLFGDLYGGCSVTLHLKSNIKMRCRKFDASGMIFFIYMSKTIFFFTKKIKNESMNNFFTVAKVDALQKSWVFISKS